MADASPKEVTPYNADETGSLAGFTFAERFIESGYGYMGLSGVHNTRDLGGMPGADGRLIAPGRLIRSGELARATDRDAALLRGLGLDCVIDLRTERERAAAPEPDKKLPEASFEFVPVVKKLIVGITHEGGLMELVKSARSYEKNAADRMRELYAAIVTAPEGREGYRRFFELVLETGEKGPGHAVLWHCTAGKDRTGIGAALLERALGVPQDLIVEDYLASDRYTEPLLARALESLGHKGVAPTAGAALKVFYGVNAQNLESAFDAMAKGWGSVEAYMAQELGVDDAMVERLRSCYLVPAV